MIIKIAKFAKLYYGVEFKEKVKISHKRLSELIPNVKRCSFEDASKKPGFIAAGKIIYVVDDYNQVCPYKVPEMVRIHGVQSALDGYKCVVSQSNIRHYVEELTIDLEDLGSIPTYELGKLLSVYKNSPAMYRCIRRELEKRGVYSNKVYRARSVVLKLEETLDLPDECDYSSCINRCRSRVRRSKTSAEIRKKGRW